VALHLAVAFGGAGRDPSVLDAVAFEQLAQAAVVDVAPRVVGLQAPRGDAVFGEEPERALDEAGHRLGLFVGADLGVDQPGVVVDDRVTELPADAGLLLGAGAVTIARDGVTWPREARQALGVHLQQITGAGPLKAPHLLSRRSGRPRDPAPFQAAADRGVGHPEL